MRPPKDLTPYGDVMGGSPRTPLGGVPVSEYQQYVSNGNGNGVWKAIATGLGGLVVGLLLAWFTAFQNKGITSKDMQDYVDKYSPVMPKDTLTLSIQIGELRGKQDRIFDRLGNLESNEKIDERDFTEFKTKTEKNNDLVADLLGQKVKK